MSRITLEEELDSNESTIKRTIRDMRIFLDAPIDYNHELGGYYYNQESGERPFEIPGLWFNSDELFALITTHKLLSDIQPGLLNDSVGAFRNRIETLLKDKVSGKGEVAKRVRILQSAVRPTDAADFKKITTALVNRQQINVLYHSRSKDKTTDRMLSPQRLIYYRDNWYLDAWCHLQNELRIFSLDRIKPTFIADIEAKDISDREMDEHFTQTFGIFAGSVQQTAVLMFSNTAARWVADEQWHPQQEGEVQRDGGYILKVPYGNPTELIREILKHGAEVEVLEPETLREQVRAELKAALKKY